MMYHAVCNRCLLDLGSIGLGASREEILVLLESKGVRVANVMVFMLARMCVGTSRYRRCASMREAPHIVDCASLIKWLYAQRGIWLPRDLILWLDLGSLVKLDELGKGDLVFTDGYT